MSDDFDIGQLVSGDDESDETFEVTSPSGATVRVMTQEEADHYNRISAMYLQDNKFSNISDKLELDRVLTFELASYRCSQWLTRGEDYQHRKVNNNEIQKSMELFSKEIRGIKKDLGIDKSTRDKDQGESLAEYIHNLGIRAKEFGVTRNKQATEAITLLMQIRGMITAYENSNAAERKEFGFNLEDLVEWIKQQSDTFDKIDADLRKKQTYWISEL